jgi:hypothetical protein
MRDGSSVTRRGKFAIGDTRGGLEFDKTWKAFSGNAERLFASDAKDVLQTCKAV